MNNERPTRPDPRVSMLERIENDFVYHAPFGDQVARYAEMRAKLLETAKHVVENTPPGREQSLALTHLEEAMFWSNAAIARNEKPEPETCETGHHDWESIPGSDQAHRCKRCGVHSGK